MTPSNFLINTNEDLYPCFQLTPFTNIELVKNYKLKASREIYDYLNDRFRLLNYTITSSGRHSINLALTELKPTPESIITIITTSNNFYVSKCVTEEIQKFCRWNRKISDKTTILLLIHEFGYPIENPEQYLKFKLPIIEDCAYSFNSHDKLFQTGNVGDYIIYSFPKYFPVQAGGLLVSKKALAKIEIPVRLKCYIENTMSYYIKDIELISIKRRRNYMYFLEKTRDLPIKPRFILETGVVPGVFLFNFENKFNLEAMKTYLKKMGVQCSVFYGDEAFFLPLHQNIKKEHIDFFVTLMRAYLNI